MKCMKHDHLTRIEQQIPFSQLKRTIELFTSYDAIEVCQAMIEADGKLLTATATYWIEEDGHLKGEVN